MKKCNNETVYWIDENRPLQVIFSLSISMEKKSLYHNEHMQSSIGEAFGILF